MGTKVKISENQLSKLTQGLVHNKTSLNELDNEKCCCRYEWIGGEWKCTKKRRSCCDESAMNLTPAFAEREPMALDGFLEETELRENKIKQCCVCWKKVGVGGWADQDGPGWKWKCCGYKPCSSLTMGAQLGK